MQVIERFYNPQVHNKYKALTVKQPYASAFFEGPHKVNLPNIKSSKEKPHYYGKKCIEVRSKNTKYRGDLLICSSQKPNDIGLPSGCTMGYVELYDVKRVEDFTEQDWKDTCIPADRRKEITTGYGWLLRNPRRVIELPVSGQLGIWNLYFTKDQIIEYPTNLIYDPENIPIPELNKHLEKRKEPRERIDMRLFEFTETDGEDKYFVAAESEVEAVSCFITDVNITDDAIETYEQFEIRELDDDEVDNMKVHIYADGDEELEFTTTARDLMPVKIPELICTKLREQ